MTNEEKFVVGMSINRIATVVSKEDFDKIKESLSLIEKAFVKLCDELEEVKKDA